MSYMDKQLLKFKNTVEKAIVENGTEGKASCIRSSVLINLIHDAVKQELIEHGVNKESIFPPFE